jgi:hypothetical protein
MAFSFNRLAADDAYPRRLNPVPTVFERDDRQRRFFVVRVGKSDPARGGLENPRGGVRGVIPAWQSH